jgi:hypothetical protein
VLRQKLILIKNQRKWAVENNRLVTNGLRISARFQTLYWRFYNFKSKIVFVDLWSTQRLLV